MAKGDIYVPSGVLADKTPVMGPFKEKSEGSTQVVINGQSYWVRVLAQKPDEVDHSLVEEFVREHIKKSAPAIEIEHYLPESIFERAIVDTPLELFVDPGSAPPEVIADILSDISAIYRRLGGSGITFSFNEATVLEEEFA